MISYRAIIKNNTSEVKSMKKNSNAIIVSGLALFSMFFGAGNLIFPPSLGLLAGNKFTPAVTGFLMTAVGIVLLAVVASTKAGGSIESIAGTVGKKFSVIFGTIVILAIGPLLAIPRTAATTYEIIQGSLIPSLSPIVGSIIFFAIVLFFVLFPKNIIDSLGKILTPALLVVLALILFKGITNPIGAMVATDLKNPFITSLIEGYQTMDALAALVFTTIISNGLRLKGFDNKKELVKATIFAALIAGVGLSIVYGGLLYIGSTMSGLNLGNIDRVSLLILATDTILGEFGKYALSLAITLACLTTAIGLTSTVGGYFENLTEGRFKAVYVVFASTAFSAYLSIKGVTQIIEFAGTILSILYPISMVLIFLNLFPNKFKSMATYQGAVIGAFIPTIIQFIFTTIKIEFWMNFKTLHPALESFLWVIPAIIFAIIFTKKNIILKFMS